MRDIYKTIEAPSEEVLYKEKGSKFFGYAIPIHSEENVKQELEQLKKQHHTARHFCYAWQLGFDEQVRYRAQDDGEPNNSAGLPIYGQLQSFEVTNLLVVVVRYFGGTKLGVGGLIQAYKTTAKMALDSTTIVEKFIASTFELTCEYDMMSIVLRLIQEHNIELISQKLTAHCVFIVSVRKKEVAKMKAIFEATYKLSYKILEL